MSNPNDWHYTHTFPTPVDHVLSVLDSVVTRVLGWSNRCEHCGEQQWIKRRHLTEQEIEDIWYARIPMESAFIHGRRCLTTCPAFGSDIDTISPKGD